MSSVAHPGVVAIASCSPRLLMRIGARRTASPASVVFVACRRADSLGRDVHLFGKCGGQPQLERNRPGIDNGQGLNHRLERRCGGFQGIAADRNIGDAKLTVTRVTVVTVLPS